VQRCEIKNLAYMQFTRGCQAAYAEMSVLAGKSRQLQYAKPVTWDIMSKEFGVLRRGAVHPAVLRAVRGAKIVTHTGGKLGRQVDRNLDLDPEWELQPVAVSERARCCLPMQLASHWSRYVCRKPSTLSCNLPSAHATQFGDFKLRAPALRLANSYP